MNYLDNEQLNVAIPLNTDGKVIRVNPNDENSKLRRRNRRELRRDAKNLALGVDVPGREYTAEDYANGNVVLTGNKNRVKLFDRTFNKYYSPNIPDISESVVINRPDYTVLDPTTLSADKLNNLSPEEQQAVARYWRDSNRLLGEIGGGIEHIPANQHAREYVSGLVDPAVTMIGATMGMTNPITTAFLNEGLAGTKQVVQKALPYVDDAVSATNKWLGKQNQWWNPIHWGRVLFDPTKANTAVGQGIGVGADLVGGYMSGQDLVNLGNKWQSGQFDWSDIPQAGLDVAGMLPGFSYLKNTGVSLGKGISRYADDVSDAYKMLVNGEEPVLEFRANALRQSPEPYRIVEEFQNREGTNRIREQVAQIRDRRIQDLAQWSSSDELPPPPREVTIDMPTTPNPIPTTQPMRSASRPVQFGSLPQGLVNDLYAAGFRRWDIQNLLDRGFSPQQMLRLADVQTEGLTSNRRANVLAQRLRDLGELPSLPTRQDYLHSFVDGGGTLMQYRGRPYTFEEWNELSETHGLDPFEHEWRGGMDWIDNVFFGGQSAPTMSPYSPAVPLTPREIFTNNPEFGSLREKLSKYIGLFGKEQFAEVQPKMLKILEDGIASGKSPADIESEIADLYVQYDKPFGFVSDSFGGGNANASRYNPHSSLSSIFEGNPHHTGTTHIRATPYPSVDDISPVITRDDLGYSAHHLYVVDPTTSELKRFTRDMREGTPHGGVLYERSKSAQSSPMAHLQYVRNIQRGEGVGSFIRNADGTYWYQPTNGFEGTRWHPRPDDLGQYDRTFRLNTPTVVEHIDRNIAGMEEFLNAAHPSTYDDLGYPTYRMTVGNQIYTLPVVKQQVDGQPRLVLQRPNGLMQAATDMDNAIEARIGYQATKNQFVENVQQMLDRKYPGQSLRVQWGDYGELQAVRPNGEVIPLRELKTKLPGLDDMIQQTRNVLENAMRNAGFYDFEIYQPVAAMRMKKHGGKIIDNLNPSIKTLLNIK